MPRIVLGVEYDGSRFHGWQHQQGKRTVQAELEKALTKIASRPITVVCAGRTDAGVHALEQVVHFDCEVERDPRAWVMGSNTQLPDDVRVLWARPAVDDFHARYNAIARFYRYIFFNRPVNSALVHRQMTWCFEPLDERKMHRAAQALIGEHDFSSFRATSCQSVSPCRLMYFIDVHREQDRVIMDISANAFVHHMVRNIAGVLMDIGRGRKPEDWTEYLLQVKDRKQGGLTAPPQGLYLGGVFYPEKYGISAHPVFAKLPKNAERFD
ncbi:tRNA pseudouridine(38-40) synthase TruA [Methylomarinum vadi]|uniref:tRNA pseudouridine(38-40) synthase TruA n=1 Tax=Methylomarinum vadi TaxID=438855 RepID=UPI0004DEFF30|nr:tRNA pseudouridine(38-40) synthase TruA [Methylomarinum vadi]